MSKLQAIGRKGDAHLHKNEQYVRVVEIVCEKTMHERNIAPIKDGENVCLNSRMYFVRISIISR